MVAGTEAELGSTPCVNDKERVSQYFILCYIFRLFGQHCFLFDLKRGCYHRLNL